MAAIWVFGAVFAGFFDGFQFSVPFRMMRIDNFREILRPPTASSLSKGSESPECLSPRHADLVFLSVPVIIGETTLSGPYWRGFGPSMCLLSVPNLQIAQSSLDILQD
jgi:hypothetical protein